MPFFLNSSIIGGLMLVLCLGGNAGAAVGAGPGDTQELAGQLGRVPRSAVFREAGYDVWCGSLVRADDGQYHLFYSRWPTKLTHEAWVTRSEVAHAVGPSPFGPFQPRGVALAPRGSAFWDGDCTHNPTVIRHGDRYYLYYMGNRGDDTYWDHRNHQQIGVAVATSPDGPWERGSTPLLSPGAAGEADDICVTNPSVTAAPGGRFLMIYKGVSSNRPGPKYGPVANFTAWADSPTGPFRKTGVTAFTHPKSEFPAEDPFVWHAEGRFHAVVKDMAGLFTGAGISLAQFSSTDGEHWIPAAKPLICDLGITWEDGTLQRLAALERPQVYFENGRPVALLCAAAESLPRTKTVNVQIPLGRP